MRYEHKGDSFAKKLVVLGAREDSNNIGDRVVNLMNPDYGWYVVGDDCCIDDGRPRGSGTTDGETLKRHGYVGGDGPDRYARYDVPAFDQFQRWDADALVVTLGTTYKDHFADIREWEVERVIRANLILPLEACRRFVQAAEAPGWRADDDEKPRVRSIVLVGSYAHTHPFTNGTLYCAAKAGLNMAARVLGWELTDRGYRIHVVHPYHVQGTPMWSEVETGVMKSKGMSWEEADAYNRKDLKMPDLLTPEEVAEVIALLLTERSLGWTSGTPIELFGGSR